MNEFEIILYEKENGACPVDEFIEIDIAEKYWKDYIERFRREL